MFYCMLTLAAQEIKYFIQMQYVSWELWFYVPHPFSQIQTFS